MEVEKIKALKELYQGSLVILQNLYKNESSENLNLEKITAAGIKRVYDRMYKSFEDELQRNIMTYSDNQDVYDYILAYFEDELNGIHYPLVEKIDIIRKGFRIEILCAFRQGIVNGFQKIRELSDQDSYTGEYHNIQRIRDRMENGLTEEEEQNQERVTDAPDFDSRFDFVLLQKEAAQLPSAVEKMKLFKNRQHDLRIWQKLYDIETNSFIPDDYIYSKQYYPNFEVLCNLEIERYKDQLEIEKLELSISHKHDPGEEVDTCPVVSESHSELVWDSTDTDLLELAVSLHRTNALKHKDGKKITQKEIIDHLQQLFNTDIKNVDSKLSVASNRKKDRSPFLTKLKNSFESYCEDKLEKKDQRTH